MAATIVLLHLVGWGMLLAQSGAGQGGASSGVLGVGLGVTAYVLGMRHAFDADHIAVIDNSTRKMLAEGSRPLSVGFWFSLGHSTVVFVLVALLAAGVSAVAGQVSEESSALQQVAGLFGTMVSGLFLLAIALINSIVLVGLVRILRGMRSGTLDEAALEAQLQRRGALARLTGRATRAINRPWQLYPVGFLFGLGLDTATEVSLLVLAGGAAAASLPAFAVLTLPTLFAAGMCLLDTADGLLMFRAYGWADDRPGRRIFYNLTVTGLSVGVALLIGGVELIGVVADRLGITQGPLAGIAAIDLNDLGFLVVALFLVVWLGAVAVWKLARREQS